MNTNNTRFLTENEFMFLLVGTVVGAGVLGLPAGVVADAKQDGTIATILGSIYPFYLVLFGIIFVKQYPNMTIMNLSTQFFGKIIGNILNLLFAAQSVFYSTAILSGGINIFITYAVWFMTPIKLLVIFVILIVYACNQGLNVLARINIVSFYMFTSLVFSSVIALTKGSFLNLQPILATDYNDILKGGISSAYAYGGMELFFIFHTYVKNRDQIIRLALTSTILILLFYTWVVFTALIYFGPNIVPHGLWPYFFVTESIRIPVINNYRLIVTLFWPIIVFRAAANHYFATTLIINNMTGIKSQTLYLVCVPLLFLTLLYGNEVERREILDKLTVWVTLFNLFYISIIGLIALFKKNTSASKNQCLE